MKNTKVWFTCDLCFGEIVDNSHLDKSITKGFALTKIIEKEGYKYYEHADICSKCKEIIKHRLEYLEAPGF